MKVAFIRNPKTGSSAIAKALKETNVFIDAHRAFRNFNPGYTTFAFVRNPWERLFSWWRHQNYCKTETFRDYVLNRAHVETYVHGRWDTGLVVADQWEWINRGDGERPSLVGRFEFLDQDFPRIVDALGIPAAELEQVNLSIRRKTHPYDPMAWDPEMVQHMDPLFGAFADEFRYGAPV